MIDFQQWQAYIQLMIVAVLILGLSACASCDYEETHAFMKRANMQEVCYNLANDDRVSGSYCLRRLSGQDK